MFQIEGFEIVGKYICKVKKKLPFLTESKLSIVFLTIVLWKVLENNTWVDTSSDSIAIKLSFICNR